MKPSEKDALTKHHVELVDYLKVNVGLVLQDIEAVPNGQRAPFLDIDVLETIKGEGVAKTSTQKALHLLNVLKSKDDGFELLIFSLVYGRNDEAFADRLCETATPGDSAAALLQRWTKNPQSASQSQTAG